MKGGVKVGVAEDGMLVICPVPPFIPSQFCIAHWEPKRGERRIWYQEGGVLLVPRGHFHLHINDSCSKLVWDGVRLIETDCGAVLLDLNIDKPTLMS